MSHPLAQHPRFFDSEGLRTACARLRRNDEIDPVQVRADAQTLMTALPDIFHWLEGMARRERLRNTYPTIVFVDGFSLTAEEVDATAAPTGALLPVEGDPHD